MSLQTLTSPRGTPLYYLGLGPEAGPLPAFIYFALSGEESLSLHPYNQPALYAQDPSLRVFSLTLPGHGPGFDKLKAIHYWAEQMRGGEYLIENFLESVVQEIAWLIESGMIAPESIAVGGLSRGGLIATHVAARDTRIRTLLAFAPLTRLEESEEFRGDTRLSSRIEPLNLSACVERLTHLHHLRFYIGNRDTRVSTDACYQFIRHLAEIVHEKRARHCQVELLITPSIGHKGHGTAPQTFEEGAHWLKHCLQIG